MPEPLLTRVIVARNDDYLGNFKQRLELAVNYTCRNVELSGNLASFETLICDWNSESPLRRAVNLNEAAQAGTYFLEVPPETVARHKLDFRPISLGMAFNVAVRRARGEFILVTPADVLFPFPSVAALFALLRGEAHFPADIRNCCLGIERYLIPWPAAERLRMENLERYLLLHTTHMKMGRRYHGLTGGEGGQLMPRGLWHELRGFNESLHAWGVHDIDLGRRAAQSVPQLKATLAGVYGYDFQQRPQLREAMEGRKNIDVESPGPVVNGPEWGLALENIPPRPAEPCPQAVNLGPPPRPYDTEAPETVFPADRAEALAGRAGAGLLRVLGPYGLGSGLVDRVLGWFSGNHKLRPFRYWAYRAAFEFIAGYWLDKRNNGENSPWFCGEWFGESGRLRAFFASAWRKRLYRGEDAWGVRTICFGLAVLAVTGRLRPARFFYAGARDKWVAQFAAFAEPALEIVGYDHWQEKQGDISSNYISVELKKVCYQGYCHLISGPLDTAFARLRKTPWAGEPCQGLALDLDFLRPLGAGLPGELAPLLAHDCAVILRGEPETRAQFADALINQGFRPAGAMPGVSILIRGGGAGRKGRSRRPSARRLWSRRQPGGARGGRAPP
jgi:hypothetical protein